MWPSHPHGADLVFQRAGAERYHTPTTISARPDRTDAVELLDIMIL